MTDAKRRASSVPFVAGIECSYLPAYDVDITESSGHQDHLGSDLRVAARHVRQIRYPIRWPRVEAAPGRFDWSTTDAALDEVREAGLEPIVDLLHHTSHPVWLTDGLRDRRFGPAFVRFVAAVVERYPWIPAYTVINEPLTTFLMAGQEAIWPPYDSGLEGFVRLATNAMPAVVEAGALCRTGWPAADHVWVDTCEHHAASDAPEARTAAAFANDRRHALLDLALGHELDRPRPFLEALRRAGGASLFELPPIQVDVLGLDYYWQLEWWYDQFGGHCPSPRPVGFAAIAEHYAHRYGVPVMLTETNVRGLPSDKVSWLRYVQEQCETAIARGVDLRGLCWYPLVDSCDWDSLLARNASRIDPVGIWSIEGSPQRHRFRTTFTQWWETAAAGARAAELPAYRFQSPLREQLSGFLPQLADWPWIDPPDAVSTTAPPATKENSMSALNAGSRRPARPAVSPALGRDLVVVSHLRWTWVWQRPQHLISRFAARRHATGAHTWFVEEPVFADIGRPVLRTESAGEEITRVWLDVPTPDPAPPLPEFDLAVAADYPELLAGYLREVRGSVGLPLDVWLYTPIAYPLIRGLQPEQVIYDVMDDLSSFAYAPPGLELSFQRLLADADLVFTGGRSLHRSVSVHRQRDCHLFPSGVDTAHYTQSLTLRRPHPRPVAGYVGVLDERLDLELIGELAASLPDWTIRMVGPVIKIDPAELPQAANLEYTGHVDYADLPAAMAGFDVALMPFALNQATRCISPTKTLEYLAAGLPVVSTRVPDVVADFADMVALADTADEFAAACRQARSEDVGRREARLRRLREKHEWDVIAAEMAELMGAKLSAPAIRGASA